MQLWLTCFSWKRLHLEIKVALYARLCVNICKLCERSSWRHACLPRKRIFYYEGLCWHSNTQQINYTRTFIPGKLVLEMALQQPLRDAPATHIPTPPHPTPDTHMPECTTCCYVQWNGVDSLTTSLVPFAAEVTNSVPFSPAGISEPPPTLEINEAHRITTISGKPAREFARESLSVTVANLRTYALL